MASAEKGASGLFSGAAGTVACGFSSQKIGRDDVIWLFTALIWPSGTDSPNYGCCSRINSRIFFCQWKNWRRLIPFCSHHVTLGSPLAAASWRIPAHFFIRTFMIALFNENASPIVWLDPFYLRGGAIHRHRLIYAYRKYNTAAE